MGWDGLVISYHNMGYNGDGGDDKSDDGDVDIGGEDDYKSDGDDVDRDDGGDVDTCDGGDVIDKNVLSPSTYIDHNRQHLE